MRKVLTALVLTLACIPALADKRLVESPAAPKAIGPYSQAIQSGKLVFVSGSLPFDPENKIDYTQQDVTAQTKRVIDNIALELAAAKLTLEKRTEEWSQQREWFEVTLASIGDAVITTDIEARVTFLNPVAELLTGWTQEAVGQPLAKVVRIVNEESPQPAIPKADDHSVTPAKSICTTL